MMKRSLRFCPYLIDQNLLSDSHDVYSALYALTTVAGFVVNGTGADALAVRRCGIDAFDRAD
jgi:hypothetical protein